MATIKLTPEGVAAADWRYYKFIIAPKDKAIKTKRTKAVLSPIPEAAQFGLNAHPDETSTLVKMNALEAMFEAAQVKKKVSPEEIADFYNAIAKSMKANIALAAALRKSAGMAKSPYFRGVIGTICYTITKDGGKLSTAMALFPQAFEESAIAMVEAGENAGETKEVFARLAYAATENIKMMRKIKGALIYPGVLAGSIMSVVALIQFFVIPKMMPMFQTMLKSELPLSTRIVMGTGDFFQAYPWVVAFPFILVIILKAKWAKIVGNPSVQRSILKVPVVGEVVMAFCIIRSFRTLAILLKAVVPLNKAFGIAARVSGNIVVADYYGKMCKRCISGQGMEVAFYAERHALGELGSDIAEQVAVGQATGNTTIVLNEIVEGLKDEVSVKLEALPNLANFVMLVSFAPIVILIALAVMEPSLQMAQDTLAGTKSSSASP